VNPFQRIIKNSVALSADIFLERAISFILPWYIARVLGREAMGEYNLTVTFITIFTPAGVWGLNQLLPRLIAREHSKAGFILIHASLLGGVTSVAATLGLFVTVQVLDYPTALRNLILLGGLSLLLRSESILSEAIIKGMEKMEWIAFVRLPTTIIRVAVSIWLLSQGHDVASVFIVLIIYQFLVWLTYLWVFKRTLPRFQWQCDRKFVIGLLSQSIPFVAIGVFGVTFKQIDSIFLSKLWDTETVGIYSTGALFVQAMYMLAPAVMESLFPGLSRLYVVSRQRFTMVVSGLLKLVFVSVLPIALALFAFADVIILTAFGAEYNPSITVFQILVLGIVPSYLGRLLFRAILASDNERVMPRVVIVNDLLNISLNILLIPRYGAIGASVAAVGTELCGLLQNAFYVQHRISKLDFKGALLRPAACTLISLLVFWLISYWNPRVAWLASTAVLAMALLLSRTVTPQDVARLSKL
jgi:O-antigen/teichoic acid export membrane protein